MKDDLRYARATGSLTAMTRFLIGDLESAVEMLDSGDDNSYEIKQFKCTIDHGKRVLKQVEDET